MNLWQMVAIPWGLGLVALALLILGWKAQDPATIVIGVIAALATFVWFGWLIHLHRSHR